MQADWFFDFISPFSYLQLRKVREWRQRLDITPVPIAFGAVLNHTGTLGPAEVPGKREHMYRHIVWQAERAGIALKFPPTHPFNPLVALRLCIATGTTWESIEKIFEHIWRDGRAGVSVDDLADIARRFGIDDAEKAAADPTVKAQLRANTDNAIAAGVFGVPTLRVGDEMFWGNDTSAMVEEWLDDPQRFASAEYQRVGALPLGVERRRQ
ncbi:MAG TPA: 2-hydroxychromene-2-carboxylate isomerase [Rudaea sp.]|jgi:2-hydroxychromene-2-carboxylate isomerase|nr:2-hydroxychromene-2-carboxylate isomerase [Rudaea sp.]